MWQSSRSRYMHMSIRYGTKSNRRCTYSERSAPSPTVMVVETEFVLVNEASPTDTYISDWERKREASISDISPPPALASDLAPLTR